MEGKIFQHRKFRKFGKIAWTILTVFSVLVSLFPQSTPFHSYIVIIWVIYIGISAFLILKDNHILVFPIKNILENMKDLKFNEINQRSDWLLTYGALKKHGPFHREGTLIDKGVAESINKEIFADHGTLLQDTEVSEKLLKENNIVAIGGPLSNSLTAYCNSQAPIQVTRIERYGLPDKAIYMIDKNKLFTSRSCGVIELIPNPWNPLKVVLIIMGLHRDGVVLAGKWCKDLISNQSDSEYPALVLELKRADKPERTTLANLKVKWLEIKMKSL